MRRVAAFICLLATVAASSKTDGSYGYVGPACAVVGDTLYLHGAVSRRLTVDELDMFADYQADMQQHKQLASSLLPAPSAPFVPPFCEGLDDAVEVVLRGCQVRHNRVYSNGKAIRQLNSVEKHKIEMVIAERMSPAYFVSMTRRRSRRSVEEGEKEQKDPLADISSIMHRFLRLNSTVTSRFLPVVSQSPLFSSIESNWNALNFDAKERMEPKEKPVTRPVQSNEMTRPVQKAEVVPAPAPIERRPESTTVPAAPSPSPIKVGHWTPSPAPIVSSERRRTTSEGEKRLQQAMKTLKYRKPARKPTSATSTPATSTQMPTTSTTTQKPVTSTKRPVRRRVRVSLTPPLFPRIQVHHYPAPNSSPDTNSQMQRSVASVSVDPTTFILSNGVQHHTPKAASIEIAPSIGQLPSNRPLGHTVFIPQQHTFPQWFAPPAQPAQSTAQPLPSQPSQPSQPRQPFDVPYTSFTSERRYSPKGAWPMGRDEQEARSALPDEICDLQYIESPFWFRHV